MDVIKINSFKCIYVDNFTHYISSIGAPNRESMFIRGTNTEQREFPENAGRNAKATIFYKGGA
jgi:hypothetical protein